MQDGCNLEETVMQRAEHLSMLTDHDYMYLGMLWMTVELGN